MRQQRWFERHRQEWIAEVLCVFGFINRGHLMRKFGISEPQASLDLKAFLKRYPAAMVYDMTRKCYVGSAVHWKVPERIE